MHDRCRRPKHKSHKYYAGIEVCDRWDNFETFLLDMGERPKGTSLDRRDNSKGYSPDNCRWATPTQQQRNRRSNRMIEHNGQTYCLAEWAEQLSIPYKRLWHRLDRGLTFEQAIGN
jgi:hypothetical protein